MRKNQLQSVCYLEYQLIGYAGARNLLLRGGAIENPVAEVKVHDSGTTGHYGKSVGNLQNEAPDTLSAHDAGVTETWAPRSVS